MRKNTKEVLAALSKGKSCRKCEAINTDGHVAMSYSTIVAIRHPADSRHWYVTESGTHSVTTTIQTNGLAVGLSHELGFQVTRVPQFTIDNIIKIGLRLG